MSTSSMQHKPAALANLPNPIFGLLHEAKTKSGKSFETLGKEIGRGELYTAAIFYGQAKPEEADLTALSKALDVRETYLRDALGPDFYPDRGGLTELPPRDPTMYRLYEWLISYGAPIKHLIHEKFGDGIMSLVDFEGAVERIEDPKGDRVKITLNGKFLPFRRW